MSEESVETFENNLVKFSNCEDQQYQFPNGLRVLLVDDSVVCLRVITALLKKCHYQVTPKENSAEALMLLRQNEDHFDIVLTNVHMHEIDGFKLLEAGLELEIPVIMMSASDSKEIIMKGIEHGARDYLLKPLRLEEIKNLWQHVYRKRLPFIVSTTTPVTTADGVCDATEDQNNKSAKRIVPKRKAMDDGVDDANEEKENRSKRERVRWTQPLHDKFVDVVAKLGGVDKAVPKKILEMMGAPDITREKVASHLQKYRKAIKKRMELEGQGSCNINNVYNNHNNHHPPQPHAPPRPSNVPANIMLAGPAMRGMLTGPTMAASNYQEQFNSLQVHGGYPQPLQVLPSTMMPQQPRMHFDRNLVLGPNNSLFNTFNHHHPAHNVQQPHLNLQQNHQDIKGLHPLDCFDSRIGDHDQLIDRPSVIDPSYDQFAANNFLDVVCPSLLDDF